MSKKKELKKRVEAALRVSDPKHWPNDGAYLDGVRDTLKVVLLAIDDVWAKPEELKVGSRVKVRAGVAPYGGKTGTVVSVVSPDGAVWPWGVLLDGEASPRYFRADELEKL